MRKDDLGRAVGDALELKRGKDRNNPGYHLAKIVIQVVVDALKRGENVEIEGLGAFSIRTRIPTQTAYYHFGLKKYVRIKPIRKPKVKYVHFRAAGSLRHESDE